MEFNEIEQMAYNKEKIKPHMPQHEISCYFHISNLYRMYQSGKLTKEDALIRKDVIKNAFEDQVQIYKARMQFNRKILNQRILISDRVDALVKQSKECTDYKATLIQSLEIIGILIDDTCTVDVIRKNMSI